MIELTNVILIKKTKKSMKSDLSSSNKKYICNLLVKQQRKQKGKEELK